MAATVTAAPAKRERNQRRQEMFWGYGFTSIWVVGFIIFSAVPLFLALYLSFTDWNPIRGPFWNAHLNGLHNYETFLQDRRYWHAVWNTVYYAVGSVALVNVLSIPLAMLLNQKLRGINLYRTIAYLPAIMPGVAAVLIFRLIFQPSAGILSWFLTKTHIQCDPTVVTCNPLDWLSNPKLTMPAVIMLSAWGFGQTMLIYLAGLQGIDASYYEAASIDGATAWNRFRSITLPLLSPAIFFNVVTGLIGAFQEFTKFVIFSGGANGYTGGPSDSLLTLFPYIWEKGYEDNFLGLAIAMAFGLFVLIGIFTVLNFAGQRRWVFYQEERS
jgi:multiple sugar transport system permease protein